MRNIMSKVYDTVVEFVNAIMAFVKNLFGYYTKTGLSGYMEHRNVMLTTGSMTMAQATVVASMTYAVMVVFMVIVLKGEVRD